MSAAAMMRQTCVIYRPVVTQEVVYGSSSEEFSVAVSDVRCSIQMNNTSVGVEYQRLTGRRLALGFFPVDTDLRARDRIVWRGVQWEVRGKPLNEVNRRSHLVADLEELDGNLVLAPVGGDGTQWDFSDANNSAHAMLTWD